MRYLLLLSILAFFKLNAQNPIISNQKTFGGIDKDVLFSAVVMNDNSIVAGGYSDSPVSADKTSSSYGNSDYWITKFDSNLNPLWQRSYGGSGNDFLTQIIKTKDNNILCVGYSNSGVSGNKTAVNKGITDVWAIMLDSNGNEIWQKTYRGSGSDAFPKVAENKDGSLYFVSSSLSGISGDKTDTSRGWSDYWLIKTDSSGSVIWDKTYGGNDFELYPSISITDSFELILSGISPSDSSGEKSDNSVPNTGSSYNTDDIWVLKLDSMGNIIWDRTFGGDMFDQGGESLIHNDKSYIVASTESGISGNKTSINKGDNDFWLIGWI